MNDVLGFVDPASPFSFENQLNTEKAGRALRGGAARLDLPTGLSQDTGCYTVELLQYLSH